MNDSGISDNRNILIDIARFYAMILVYYGHIVEQVMYLGSPDAAIQYKFIYSFHMPLFFLLSGTIVTDKKLSLPAGPFFKQTMAARLPPYIFFSVLMALLSLFISGWHPLGELTNTGAYMKNTVATLFGFPGFCIPLWFMALLIGVELFHYCIARFIKHPGLVLCASILLYLCGYYMNSAYNFVGEQASFWFVHEIPVVYIFYVTGYLLRKSGLLDRKISSLITGPGVFFFLTVTLLTFNMNEGPFRIIQAVVIVLSGHGDLVLFLLTSLTGSCLIILLAGCSPGWRWLSYMGENSLSLFCLNGVFYHFVNPVCARWLAETFDLSHSTVFIYSASMTVASLLLCIPFVYLFTTYVPQFLGKPLQRGPLLKPLIKF